MLGARTSPSAHRRDAIFLGLTKTRSADILSASGRSPLRLAEEFTLKKFALACSGVQDVRAPKMKRVSDPAQSEYGWHSRGYLPHFDGGSIPQGVTFRLFDSLPKTVLEQWSHELESQPSAMIDTEMRKR